MSVTGREGDLRSLTRRHDLAEATEHLGNLAIVVIVERHLDALDDERAPKSGVLVRIVLEDLVDLGESEALLLFREGFLDDVDAIEDLYSVRRLVVVCSVQPT